jgi:tRNA-specific 2-thiouridylase
MAQTVVVAMSGGVDSSVAAALIKAQGYRVLGVMLRLWSEEGREDDNRCCTPDAMALARRVAAILGIPFYAIDARQVFYDQVVKSFLDGYSAGVTPNPCIVCNRLVRWGYMLDLARSMGADFMATGHYAQLKTSPEGKIELWRGVDPLKDQAYVLSGLNQDQLGHSLFPLGGLHKTQVRQMAEEFGLPVASRADSQDLCFLNGDDYRPFLSRYAPQVALPGRIVNRAGEVLGEHQGLAFYTIGQRKGIGLAVPQPLYVLAKDARRNELVVGTQDELGQQAAVIGPVNWISGEAPAAPFDGLVKIRYKSSFAPARIEPQGQEALIHFVEPLRDITPGQLAVVYQGDQVIGSGLIQPGVSTLGLERGGV